MTKDEKIKEAYGLIGLPYNVNITGLGWMKIKPTQFQSKYDDVDILKINRNTHYIRPKSLQGIEDNNGWVKIKSEEDLPKQEIDIFVIEEETGNILTFHLFNSRGSRKNVKDNFTHYQPIIKPKHPIY